MEGDFFGIRDSRPLSLKNRFWARLVEKLVLMSFKRDEKDEKVYHFTDADGKYFVSLRLTESLWEEKSIDMCHYGLVELLNAKGKVLIKEKIYSHRHEGTYHPLYELFELVVPNKETTAAINDIKIINKFLDK